MNSFEIIGAQLEGIVQNLQNCKDETQIIINRDGKVATISRSYFMFWQKAEKDTESLAYFTHVFGEKRIKRLTRLHGLDPTFIRKQDIEKLFVYLAEVLSSDLYELFDEIKGNKPTIRYLNEEETAALRVQFAEVEDPEMGSKEALDMLMKLLIPFSKVEDIFLSNPPNIHALSLDSGKSFESARRRVQAYEMIRRNPTSEKKWFMIVGKILSNREIPAGVIFPSACGNYCKMQKVVHKKGAYKNFLKVIGKTAQSEGNYVVYRGTRPIPRATDWFWTILEDFRLHIGTRGPQATFNETRELLTNPLRRFIHTPHGKITAIGNSLGGVHSMYDMCLHDQITRLVTIVSPGMEKKKAEAFAERVNRGMLRHVPEFDHFIEAGDVVDQGGGAFLGMRCDPTKAAVRVHIVEPVTESSVPQRVLSLREEVGRIGQLRRITIDNVWRSYVPESIYNFFRLEDLSDWVEYLPKALYKIKKVALKAHTGLTLLRPHHIFEISSDRDNELLQPILSHESELVDPRLETLRQSFYRFFSRL